MKWPTRAKASRPIGDYHANLFWGRVRIAGPDECWMWTGYKNNMGYGQYAVFPNPPQGSHRIAYALKNGGIPAGINVCHKCDNPLCCNPTHLFLGSQKDNIRDMGAKGRHATGPRNGNSKMSPETIAAIRSDYANGGISLKGLGRKHGCSDTWIARIVRGEVRKSA